MEQSLEHSCFNGTHSVLCYVGSTQVASFATVALPWLNCSIAVKTLFMTRVQSQGSDNWLELDSDFHPWVAMSSLHYLNLPERALSACGAMCITSTLCFALL